MTVEIKHLAFKGIEKKEQILFKSFLNLAKHELDYQIVVLKDGVDSDSDPSVIIVDDGYEFTADELVLRSLPMVIIGDDISDERLGYISRPVQWSDFRSALSIFSGSVTVEEEPAVLDAEAVSAPELDEVQDPQESGSAESAEKPKLELVLEDELSEDLSLDDESDEGRVLPAEVMFAIDDDPSVQTGAGNEDDDFEPINYEYELDNMSVDYNSHTNSDYMKVVDDVQQFKGDEEESPAMLLVTDDESNSTNSVLVIETNSLDAWDFSVTEASSEVEDTAESAKDAVAEIESVAFDNSNAAKQKKSKSGFDLAPGEEYWLSDNEIIADEASVLYVKTQRGMVYSSAEPGKWIDALQGKKLSKLPLNADWRPKKGLTAYPLTHLVWVNALISNNQELNNGLDNDAEYLLERWPHFDLLQLDNVLLKLCSMLFVSPESLNSLVEKSGYSRSTVRGLMNACYQEGILKKPSEVQVEDLVAASNDGVFGKIKDVFR